MKRRWEEETPLNDENITQVRENILERIRYFRSIGVDFPFSVEDEKQINTCSSKEELAKLCSEIEDFDNKLCLIYLNKFLEQKEAFKQLRSKLMIQGPQLRAITDHCWNLKVDYFALKESIAKRKEGEAAGSTNIEEENNEDEEKDDILKMDDDNKMEDNSEECESSSQQEYRKLVQFLKNLIEVNEKKFTEMARLNKEQEKELMSTLLYCQQLELDLSEAKLEIERLKNEKQGT